MMSLRELTMMRVLIVVPLDSQTRTAVCPYCGARTGMVKAYFRSGEFEDAIEVLATDAGCEHYEGKTVDENGRISVSFVRKPGAAA